MPNSNIKALKEAIQEHWSGKPSDKAKRYIGRFFEMTVTETRISAKVEGNYGIYTVSVQKDDKNLSSACSCYIGKYGNCHHCEALALTFLSNSSAFRKTETVDLGDISDLSDLQRYLGGTTLDSLLKELRSKGITQKSIAECIGMHTRHLSAVRTSELRNRYHGELGAVKLACLWVLEHLGKDRTKH